MHLHSRSADLCCDLVTRDSAYCLASPGRASRWRRSRRPRQPQAPTFRATVTHVTTDVIPRDEKGRFVPDLTKNNFTILEDGVPQTIDSFALVHGGRTFNTI